MSKSRLESFSDAIFAFAITLLVVTIAQPTNFSNLDNELASRLPAFATYALSFAVIGVMWLNHHSVFTHFAHADRGLVLCNFVLLLTIAFLPYPTQVVGEALQHDAGTRVAVIFYAGTMAMNALAWTALWLYGSMGRRLLAPSFPESQRRTATLLFTIGVVAYALAFGLAFLSPVACLVIQAIFALYYALDPLSRRAAHE